MAADRSRMLFSRRACFSLAASAIAWPIVLRAQSARRYGSIVFTVSSRLAGRPWTYLARNVAIPMDTAHVAPNYSGTFADWTWEGGREAGPLRSAILAFVGPHTTGTFHDNQTYGPSGTRLTISVDLTGEDGRSLIPTSGSTTTTIRITQFSTTIAGDVTVVIDETVDDAANFHPCSGPDPNPECGMEVPPRVQRTTHIVGRFALRVARAEG